MTGNCGEDMYAATGYDSLLEQYKNTLTTFVGPTEVLVCGDTLQVNDYSKYNWTMFDSATKKKRYGETFAEYLDRAYEIGKNLCEKIIIYE